MVEREARVTIIRHGQALHNIQHGYPHRDPPLTVEGRIQAAKIILKRLPGIIIVSPMDRTIETALIIIENNKSQIAPDVLVWPDLREAHDAECNKGSSRDSLELKFPYLNFAACPEIWNYDKHSIKGATTRAERVRSKLCDLSATYAEIIIVTHRGLIAYLIQGSRFENCEVRSYRFADNQEVEAKRIGQNVDTGGTQDFGPTLLLETE